MTLLLSKTSVEKSRIARTSGLAAVFVGILLLAAFSTPAVAQEIRYSWLDISILGQDFGRTGSQIPIVGQTVDVSADDGTGVRFRGSIGTWNNFYLFADYGSSDIDVSAVVTNTQGVFTADDEFDFTSIRGGIGYRYSIGFASDVYAEASFDTLNLDFGSFAGESFDFDEQDLGFSLGIRKMFGDNFEANAYGRYSAVGDVNLNTLGIDSDLLFGAGFGYTLIRGLSIIGDFEVGEFSRWSVGFRLDLDEN